MLFLRFRRLRRQGRRPDHADRLAKPPRCPRVAQLQGPASGMARDLARPAAGNGIHLRKRVHSLKKAHRSAGRPAAMLPAAPPCLICGSGCGSGRRGASTLSDTTVRAAHIAEAAAGCSCGSGAPSRRHWSRSSPGATRQLRRLRENAGRNTNSTASSVPIVRRRARQPASRQLAPSRIRPSTNVSTSAGRTCQRACQPSASRAADRDSAWLARFSARTRGRISSLELQTARSSRRSDRLPSQPIHSSRRRSLFEARWNSRHPSRRPSPATMKYLRWRPAGRHAPARGSGPPARRTAPGRLRTAPPPATPRPVRTSRTRAARPARRPQSCPAP